MRKIFARLQAMLTAAALAEEGEVEAARHVAAEGTRETGGRRRPPVPRLGAGAVRRAVAKGSGR